jgi:predicted metal-dependent TIM-barrel fold hydrolase
MLTLKKLIQTLLITSIVGAGSAGAADSTSANEKDPLRATLLESKEKNKGVTIHTSGNNVAMVVTALEEKYVIGRSQQARRIIIRLDRIDGVSAAF